MAGPRAEKRQVLLGLGVGGWEKRASGGKALLQLALTPCHHLRSLGSSSHLALQPQTARLSPSSQPLLQRHRGSAAGGVSHFPALQVLEVQVASAGGQTGAERAKQARQRDPAWGRGGRGHCWATRAEGSGLPEPRQHTCVSNFLSCLLRACLLPSLPQPQCSGL